MPSTNEKFLENQTISAATSKHLRQLKRYQKKQGSLLQREVEFLQKLQRLAILESAESSCRMAGIVVSRERAEELLDGQNAPHKK